MELKAIENFRKSFVTRRSFEKVVTYQKLERSISFKGLKTGLDYALYEENWQKLPYFGILKPNNESEMSIFQLPKVTKKESNYGLVFKGFLRIDNH